jgi:hypothetical protein
VTTAKRTTKSAARSHVCCLRPNLLLAMTFRGGW